MKKPLNYYCHRETNVELNIKEELEVVEKIGEGSFGLIYKVFDPVTS